MNEPNAVSDVSSRRQPSLAWACGLIVCAGLASFWNGLRGDFVFDDFIFIKHDTLIREVWPWGPLPDLNRWFGIWTFQWNYAVHGMDRTGFHIANIAIHLAAGLTLFDLVRRCLLLPGITTWLAQRSTWLALAIALIWTVHPLQTESVTYVIQRYESLMGLCFLLVLYCTLRGSQSARPGLWYGVAVAAAWAGAGTKEVMAVVPVVLWLFDRAFLAGSFARAWRERKALYLALWPIVLWIPWTVRQLFLVTPDPHAGGAGAAAGISAWEFLRTQPGVILYYLRLAAWPDELILDRGWRVAQSPWAIYGLGAVILALLAASFWASRRYPRLGFLGLAFFFILAPSSSIVPIADLAVEHRMYLPLAPLVVLVVLGAVSAAGQLLPHPEAQARWLLVGLGMVVVALALRTIRRNNDYCHAIRLWEQTVAYNPRHARGHRMLARYYFEANRYEEAEAEFATAVSLHPRVFPTWIEYGNLYYKQQNYAEARRRYEQAVQINPKSWRAWMNIGRCGLVQGDYALALAATRRAMECDPSDVTARKQAAYILATAPDENVRNGAEALDILRGTIPRDTPFDFQYLEVLAAAHAEAGDFNAAVRVARQGLETARRLDPRREGTFQQCLERYRARQPERFAPPAPQAVTTAQPAPGRKT
jgi:tetratricopeptide (TPR) repeat protein